jgi:hypothetical protein
MINVQLFQLHSENAKYNVQSHLKCVLYQFLLIMSKITLNLIYNCLIVILYEFIQVDSSKLIINACLLQLCN